MKKHLKLKIIQNKFDIKEDLVQWFTNQKYDTDDQNLEQKD